MKLDMRTFGRFLIVGFLTVAIDAAVYTLLHSALGIPTGFSKGASFATGAVFAYFANWRFTFGSRRGRFSEVAFVAVYLTALVINVAVNQGVIMLLGPGAWTLAVAFVVATAFSALWNYAGMSAFVFRKPPTTEGPESA